MCITDVFSVTTKDLERVFDYPRLVLMAILFVLFTVTLGGTSTFKGFYVTALNSANDKVGTFTAVASQAEYCPGDVGAFS